MEARFVEQLRVRARLSRLLGSPEPAEAGGVQEDPAFTSVVSEDAGTERHAVMLIHGIRTQAEWQQKVASAIEKNS